MRNTQLEAAHTQTLSANSGRDDLGQILGRLSHDLKAPVRAIDELASWIEEEFEEGNSTSSTAIAEYIKLLKSRSNRLTTLVNSLSVFARVGLSERPFEGKWDDLLDQVSARLPLLNDFDIMTDFQATPSIAQQDLVVLFEVLLSNATKHHPSVHGSLQLSSRVDGSTCILTFQDDGLGIPADRSGQAIEMFGTLERQDLVEGNGMGLSIANRIANHYGGGLSIHHSDVMTGCEVRVWFPTERPM